MFLSLTKVISLLEIYKYLILFPIVVIEGPIITIIAGFLSDLGYLKILPVFITVVIGDVTGDSIYYAIGRFGGRKFITRWGKYIGISIEQTTRLESLFSRYGAKTLFLGKITHAIASIVLIAAGIVKYPFKKFLAYTALPTLPKSLILVLIGYYFGESYKQLNRGLNIISLATFIILGVLLLTYTSFKYFSKKLQNNI